MSSSRSPFGWSLPPGVTDRMIDEAAGAFDHDDDMFDEGFDRDDDLYDEGDEGECPHNKRGHSWVENSDEQHHGEGHVYCEYCGADGDA